MDKLTPERRSQNMRRIKSKDTRPELQVRRLTHKLGYRYRLHRKSLPGKPDLVFPKRRKVIFVHGCFWHQHGATDCPITRKPLSNQAYWLPKLERTIQRDIHSIGQLKELGWEILVVWECSIGDVNELTCRITTFLSPSPTDHHPTNLVGTGTRS